MIFIIVCNEQTTYPRNALIRKIPGIIRVNGLELKSKVS